MVADVAGVAAALALALVAERWRRATLGQAGGAKEEEEVV
jgi:hypothetical protein